MLQHTTKRRITKYKPIENQVCKLILSQIWSSVCAIRYIQSEYISVDTPLCNVCKLHKATSDFDNICKNPKISPKCNELTRLCFVEWIYVSMR